MFSFSPLPELPYYAVIFTVQRTEGDNGYSKMTMKMIELAEEQPGYVGVERIREETGFGITVSYWKDEESIRRWRNVTEHMLAQKLGKEEWFKYYTIRVAKVERHYSGPDGITMP